MPTLNLLYRRSYPITDVISINVPTVREILEDEDDYYGLVSMFTAMPFDMMVQLDDAGIDFTTINAWELFVMLFPVIQMKDTSLILGDLDLKKFNIALNEEIGDVVLLDTENDIVIDRMVHDKIATTLRKIHHLEKNTKKPGNDAAKDYLLKRARAKMKRRKRMSEVSALESLIISVVNTEQFKYNYETVKDLTIYQFNESVYQIVRKVDYDNRMRGVYAGTIDVKALKQEDLTWLITNDRDR